MLHLQPRVHLEEVVAPRVDEELDRPGAAVAHRPRRADGHLPIPRAQPLVEDAARALLHDLLLAALHRALALAEVDGVPVLVGEHLDLDVARLVEELLEVEPLVAERAADSRRAEAHSERKSASRSTFFMPFPPPPAAALIMTG